ncbi:MAG TPA: malate synthase A [Gaiellaceae bacterium]|nr:malate synthase A [Gaiellaceae bacterium]
MIAAALELLAPGDSEALSSQAIEFVGRLHRELNPTRLELLARRHERQAELAAGARPRFLDETRSIRDADWRVAEAPSDLRDRRCEITGPVERKMMINALNSGARVFMADFEDACSPTWANVVDGQRNVRDAVRRRLELDTGEKSYRLNDQIATLVIRPRGWHLDERHLLVDGSPVSASLFDFGLTVFNNAREQLERGSGPYFYLPKLESHLEARLWARAFAFAEDELALPPGSIRCTVLIETILASYEMDEILYELREHGCALNAGRWDYIFSAIKKLGAVLPDRAQVTMAVPFMRAYTDLLVQTCHRRGAHAIGGMAAFIPSRRDPAVNEVALAKVREDKEREANAGFDGSWVAHPDLVPVATEVFGAAFGERVNQLDRLREDVSVSGGELIDFEIPGATITEEGLRVNVSVGIRYLAAWLAGSGAVAIDNLMEDAATAEISRAQVWSWVRAGRFTEAEVRAQVERVEASAEAKELFTEVALGGDFVEFLTVPAYHRLA